MVGELQYLELWQVRGLEDISVVGRIPTLQQLFLQALRRVTELPSFAACAELTHIHLETMKGLTDLRPGKNDEVDSSMGLPPADYFYRHPSLDGWPDLPEHG